VTLDEAPNVLASTAPGSRYGKTVIVVNPKHAG
jgi:hypothetical protein